MSLLKTGSQNVAERSIGMVRNINRRGFVLEGGVGLAAAALAACESKQPAAQSGVSEGSGTWAKPGMLIGFQG
jgi:hypothetical protein